MGDGNETAGNAVWAIAMIIIVAIIAGGLSYSGVLTRRPKDAGVDIKVNVPAAAPAATAPPAAPAR